MIFQFLYLPSLHFIQHLAFSTSVFRTELAAKGLKAQMYRVSCLLKPHKLIMRSKLSFYVSSYFLLPNEAPKHTQMTSERVGLKETQSQAKHIKQLKRNLFVSTLMPSTK